MKFFMDRRFILTILLSNLSVWFFSFLFKLRTFTFSLKGGTISLGILLDLFELPESLLLWCSVMSNSLQLHGLYIARQPPLSMGFFRQEYCSGLPLPPPWCALGIFLNKIRVTGTQELWYHGSGSIGGVKLKIYSHSDTPKRKLMAETQLCWSKEIRWPLWRSRKLPCLYIPKKAP